ncbi:MAG: hypothetical protein Q8P89_02840 [bacterium]|nr:hypothetical protein [bacterium]
MVKRSFYFLFIFYGLVLFALLLYSFTQVDLNLTLSKASVFQSLQKFFIQIGYFQRPLSTGLYLTLISLLFTFYFLLLWLVSQDKISGRQIWCLVGLSMGMLLFSYPAFSYDLFNYMFDARIFTEYNLNPYHFKPLDFPYDPWTRFMHWTHRNYPYGPSWLILTVPLSYLGFGKFLLTLLNFKILMAAAYVGAVYMTGKILEKINPREKLLGMAFLAFNPLVIIESLVSAHHEIVMMFFALWAIYLLVAGNRFHSLFSLAISAGIKYATVFLFPLWFLGFRKNLAVILSVLTLIYISTQREIQPWYFLWVLPLVALTCQNKLFTFLSFGFSFGLLLYYAPFLYLGHWNDPVPQIKFWVAIIPVIIAFMLFLLFWRHKSLKKSL